MENYEVKKVVGQGSYGKAILCRRKKDSKLCIIKQISLSKMSSKAAKQTEQESTLLSKLSHPNIVTFWESFTAKTQLHIVMEYADGGDLDNFIKNYSKKNRSIMPEKQVLSLFIQISLAIKHIHDRKILHRDLKSQNVFLTSSGLCKLGDFGVSRVLRHTVELAATQIGTPYYMSPEIMDNQKYNSKTDIWSLGCILYELMCLRLPFGGNSMRELVSNIKRATPAAPSSQYSKELRDLVNETLIKNPRQRPGINTILSRPVVRSRITNFLNETKMESEFSHTILHGVDVLRSKPPSRSEPPVAAAPPIVRKLSSVAEEPKRLSPVVAGPPVSIQKQVDSYADYKAKYLQLEKKQQELRMEKAKQEEADRISHVNRMKKDRDAAREADIQRLRQEALKMKAKEEERMKARKEAEAIRLQKEAAAAKARKEAERIRAKKEAEAMQLKREAEAARIRRDSQIAEAKLAEDAIIAQKLQEERRLKAQEKAKIERDRMDGALAAAAAKREEMKRKHRRPSVERELLEAKRIASSEESGNNPFAPLVVNVKEVKAVEERPKLGRAVPSIASRPSKAGKSPKSAHEQNTPLSVVGESPNWMANMKVAISGSDSRPSSGRRPSYAREQLKSEASVNSFQSKIKATDDAINKAKNVLELVNNMKKQQRIESVKEAEKELVRKLDIKNDKAREKLSVGSLSSDDETPAAKAPPMPPRAKSAAELLRAKKPAALAIDDDNSIASGISNDKNTPCSRKKLAESSWFSQFEARMGAIQNQVSEMQLKSPSLNRKPAESPVVAKRESFPVGKPALKPGSVSSRKSMDTPVSRNEAVKAVPVQVTKSVDRKAQRNEHRSGFKSFIEQRRNQLQPGQKPKVVDRGRSDSNSTPVREESSVSSLESRKNSHKQPLPTKKKAVSPVKKPSNRQRPPFSLGEEDSVASNKSRFSLDEYRQQKEAERAEMKRVMMEKKRQLRSKSVDVLVVPDNTEASTESSTPSSMKTTNNRMRPTMYVSGIYGDSEDDSSRASAPINGNIENQDEDGIDVLNAGLNETVNGKKLSDSMPAWEDKSSPVNNEIGDDVAQQDDYNEDEFSGIEFRTLDFEVIDGEIAAEGEVNGPISIDEKVAMEYSMMLQQMQDILQLPSVYKAPENIGDAPSPIIEDDDEFEEDSPDEVSGSEDKSFGEPSLSDESSLDPMNETASLKDLNKPQDEEFAYDGGEKVAVLRKNAPTGDDEEEEKLGMEIKSLRSYLISKVGHRNLRDAMQFLSFIHLHENEEVDDDRLLTDLEELIGSDNLQYLDDMFRLMTLEEM